MALFGKKKPAKGGSASGGKNDIKEKPEMEPVHEEVEKKDEAKPTTKLPKGGDSRAYQAVISPHVTEKASNLGALNKYIFKVSKNAGKIEIKNAIEKMYEVEVKDVAVMNVPAKFRRVGRHEGEKPGYKKAIVTLKEGNKIEIIG